MRTEDGRIIQKCLSGEAEAFGFLVDRYKASVYALVYAKIGAFADAEDLTQEVFIHAYRKLGTLRRWDSFYAWLYSIASNLCKNWFRSQSRRPVQEYLEDQDEPILEQPSVLAYHLDFVQAKPVSAYRWKDVTAYHDWF